MHHSSKGSPERTNYGREMTRMLFVFFCLALAFGAFAPPHAVYADVSFNAVGPNSGGDACSACNSLNFTHITSGTNRLLTVGVAVSTNADSGLSLAVTYNGVSMTSAGKVHSNNSNQGFIELFYLKAPAI